jgi:hypothetical protein
MQAFVLSRRGMSQGQAKGRLKLFRNSAPLRFQVQKRVERNIGELIKPENVGSIPTE